MKFLIIRLSSIGDIVLTTPVVRCLKQQILTSEIHYVTKDSYRSLIDTNPYIDEAFYVQNDLDEVIQQLKEEDYDYVIDLHHNLRSLKIKRALGKRSFSFPKLNIQKWLLTAFKIDRMPDMHIVDRHPGARSCSAGYFACFLQQWLHGAGIGSDICNETIAFASPAKNL